MDSIVNYSSEDDQESDKDNQIRANHQRHQHHRLHDKMNNIEDNDEEQRSSVYQKKSDSIRRSNKYSNNNETNYEDNIRMNLSEDSNLSYNDRNEEKTDYNSASSATTSKQNCNDNINKYSQKKDKRIEVKNTRLNYDGEDRFKSRDHNNKNYYGNREEKDNNNMNRRKYDRNRERGGVQRDRDRDRDRNRDRDRSRGRDPDRNHDRDRDQRDRNRNHRGDHRERDHERNNKSYYKDDQIPRRYHRTHDRGGGGSNDDGGYRDHNDNGNRGGRGDDYRNRDERRNRDDFRDREKDNNHRSYNRDYKINKSDRNFSNNETLSSKDYRRQDSSPSTRDDKTINEIRRDRKDLPSRQRSQERERDYRERTFSTSVKPSFQSTHYQNQDFGGSCKDQQKSSSLLSSSSSSLISINPITTIGTANITTAYNRPTLNSSTTIIENKSNTITLAPTPPIVAAAPVQLPSYYNPNVINPNKYAEQVQKRKLLWSNKKVDDTTNKWGKPTFAQDTDGKVASKFMRLMGMKNDSSQSTGGYENLSSTAVTTTIDNLSNTNDDSVKKREEMFSSMEQQYEVARQATHTMRGVGLGFGSQPRQF